MPSIRRHRRTLLRNRTLHSRIRPNLGILRGPILVEGTLEEGILEEEEPIQLVNIRIRDKLLGHIMCHIQGTHTSSTLGSVWEPAWEPAWRPEQRL